MRSADKAHLWHPFTPIDSWLSSKYEPTVIERGEGAVLWDNQGRAYLDGNSSIWTNLHGHQHPKINAAIQDQLGKISHSSFLGLSHEPGIKLAQQLADLSGLPRVFFSDDGSTAIEAALKMVFQYFQQNGAPERKTFISLNQAYHGDTVGAMSLGQSGSFHEVFSPLMFRSEKVMTPGCYRCPFNRAKPEQADARTYRKCEWECVRSAEEVLKKTGTTTAALVIEPRVQGAAGMVMHPEGYLSKIAPLVKATGGFLIADEILTGFGRTGTMFASEKESVTPDLMALAKGLTGGYLPLAATVVREEIFDGFRGPIERTFFHGHSYTGNPLGCRAALANLEIFETEKTLATIAEKSKLLAKLSQRFWSHPNVGDVRQEGMILAVELVLDRNTKEPFPWTERLAHQIGEKARSHGLLTRGLGSILFLLPPYCSTDEQLEQMVAALDRGLREVLPYRESHQ